MRVIVAHRMANNGREWTDVFARYNSGTYNNQWIVVDYKKFTPRNAIQPNTLWILEQIPGFTKSADVSAVLAKQLYWPSYNVPYFSFIYNISGYSGGNAEDGQGTAYVTAPRAFIFARDQSTVVDISSMKTIMQYNNWQTDPLAHGDPALAISSRYDIRPSTLPSYAFGGVDSKITSSDLARRMECDAISGPSHQQQPSFTWDDPRWDRQ